jgi:hypothetical protein
MESIQKYAQEPGNNKQERTIGKSSKVVLQLLTSGAVELKIQINKGDMDSGIYDISFSCVDPGNSMIFAEALMIGEEEQGEFETKIDLEDSVYTGCQLLFGTMLITFDRLAVTRQSRVCDADQRSNVQMLTA